MADVKARKSKPAGKKVKTNIDVISLVKIFENEKEKINNAPMKTVVTNSAKVTGILSTDLDLGVVIKAFDGGNPDKSKTER